MFNMGQNINKFWSGKLGLRTTLDYSQYWDFQLGEDEYILRRLRQRTNPIIWFDSNSGSTIFSCSNIISEHTNCVLVDENDLCFFEFENVADCDNKAVITNSLTRWSGALSSAITINDIGLTGIDTQYVSQMSGQTISINENQSLVLNAVNGNLLFNNQPIKYDIFLRNDYSGEYYLGAGGFFQGFWKLHEYPLELMPTRMNKGWTMEFLLKVGCCDCDTCISGVTLNDIYPENKDIFFLIGTRAENKFWNHFSGESGVTTTSGIPLAPELIPEQPPSNSFMYWNEFIPNECNPTTQATITTTTNKDHAFDIINNVLAFRLDCETNKIGYRKMAFSGVCVNDVSYHITGGTSGVTATTITGSHMEALAVLEERMSNNPIPITGSCSAETWAHVVVKFIRNFTLDGCDLYNRGGINKIDFNESSTYLKLLRYQNEIDWRKGKLVFYINGKKHFIVDDFEEIIPRQLDTHREKQQGVPFNISWGGGTQGLMESITVNGWNSGIEQDSKDYRLLMEKNFAGTWCGGYSVLKIYDKPLENYEIINNFCQYTNRFKLRRLNCCQCLPNNPYL